MAPLGAMSLTRRGWLVLASALLVACASRAQPRPAPAEEVHLVLLHTNDVHGQVLPRIAPDGATVRAALPVGAHAGEATPEGGIARIAAAIAAVRAAEPHVIAVDAGDWFQGTPEGVIGGGLPVVEALAATGYDALCVGNHDLDGGVAHLAGMLESTRLPAVLANVREAGGERVRWSAPWRIVERAGLRIALVGLLTTATPEITHADARALTFVEPAVELARAREELAGRADLVIPVAHLGVAEARELARATPDLPLVVSGHSHEALPEGVREGSTLIVQAGSRAAAVGRVDLWIEPRSGRVVRSRAALLPLAAEPEPAWRNAAVEACCSALAARASAELAEPVGSLAAPARRKRELGSSSAGNWICDAMRAHAGADVALHNKGGTRSDLPAGPVDRRALFEFLPFDNTLVSLVLRGDELEACVRQAIEDRAHKGLEYSGARVYVRRADDGAPVFVRLEVGGAPVDPAREYRVVTNSFLAGGGDGLAQLELPRGRVEDGLLLRDLIGRELARPGGATPPEEERVVLVDRARATRD